MRIGFVGLGVMGGPMAGHLVDGPNDVIVWNRTGAKAAPLKEKGAAVAENLDQLARESDVICLCVNRTEDVLECVSSLLLNARADTLFIDHSTIAPEGAIEIARRVSERNCRFVDAPVTGGSMGAQKGQLTIFCGGEAAAVAEAIDLIRPYTKNAQHVGPSGSGQKMKMANQIAVAGTLLGMCEFFNYAARVGLDLGQALEMIGSGAAGSWTLANYGPKVLKRDWSPGFSVDNQRKDFQYATDSAAEVGAALPATKLLDGLLAQLQAAGHGAWTTAAVYEVLEKRTE